jgi:hypothetical protein
MIGDRRLDEFPILFTCLPRAAACADRTKNRDSRLSNTDALKTCLPSPESWESGTYAIL